MKIKGADRRALQIALRDSWRIIACVPKKERTPGGGTSGPRATYGQCAWRIPSPLPTVANGGRVAAPRKVRDLSFSESCSAGRLRDALAHGAVDARGTIDGSSLKEVQVFPVRFPRDGSEA